MAAIHIVCFTDWIPEAEVQYQIGWSMLGLICFCILVNFLLILYFGSKQIGIVAKKWAKRFHKFIMVKYGVDLDVSVWIERKLKVRSLAVQEAKLIKDNRPLPYLKVPKTRKKRATLGEMFRELPGTEVETVQTPRFVQAKT